MIFDNSVNNAYGVVVLAAGSARRMGCPKLLLPYGEGTIVSAVLATVRQVGLPTVVVIGADQGKLQDLCDSAGVPWRINEAWQSGQGTSVACGTDYFSSMNLAGLFFVPGDTPLLEGALFRALMALHQGRPHCVAVPRYRSRTQNPVLFGSALFSRLLSLTGDVGGRQLLTGTDIEVVYQDWCRNCFSDVDTPEDYQRLCAGTLGLKTCNSKKL